MVKTGDFQYKGFVSLIQVLYYNLKIIELTFNKILVQIVRSRTARVQFVITALMHNSSCTDVKSLFGTDCVVVHN